MFMEFQFEDIFFGIFPKVGAQISSWMRSDSPQAPTRLPVRSSLVPIL